MQDRIGVLLLLIHTFMIRIMNKLVEEFRVLQLLLSDYLSADGTIKDKSLIRAEIAYNGKARPLYWSSPRVTAALDKYLEYRLVHKHGITTRKAAYRGLDPDSPLFRTGDGEPYRLIARKTGTGAISYSCDSLSQLFRKLHLQAGIEGASAASGRRTFAVRLHQKGFDLRHINELLGHVTVFASDSNIIKQYLSTVLIGICLFFGLLILQLAS